MLGEVQPFEQLPDFFIRGWDEGQAADARAENRRRVQRFQEILRDFTANGFASRVSELDLTDMSDVRVQLAGEDADVSVRVGKEDFANHFKGAVKRLDEAKSENPAFGFFMSTILWARGSHWALIVRSSNLWLTLLRLVQTSGRPGQDGDYRPERA